MLKFIAHIGHPVTEVILHCGRIINLLIEIIICLPYSLKRFRLIMQEIYFCGVKSLVIIAVSGWFVGMVLGLQGYNTLVRFGSVSMLGSVVALSLLRELSPVLTAILFAARAGTGITAGIGLMKATEQIDAMSVMAVNPLKRIVAPKFIGGIITVPLLVALFSVSGIMGGYFVGVILLHLDSGAFWAQMHDSVSLVNDVVNGLVKGSCFGVAVTLIAVYQGFMAKPTANGVAVATTKTVVVAALTTLALDYILTSLMF